MNKIPLPVNEIDVDLPYQLIFITEEEFIDELLDKGYEVNYTFAGRIYFVADGYCRFQPKFKETRKGMVQKAHKIIKKIKEDDMKDKTVVCIKEEDCYGKELPITFNHRYDVINEGTNEYHIENDYGDVGHYPKDNFETVIK